ncbi:MAG: outer membrane protein assembly factor BamD (BamD/ComL family) [Verrucomicrobiales bacterium]|jgi:outer membrane protein assembly factor BamD (BamD/ComL family)
MIGLYRRFQPNIPTTTAMRIRTKLFISAGAALCVASPSYAVLGLFEKDKITEAPAADELNAQEAAARQAFDAARQLSFAGRHDKARDGFEKLIKAYPLTSLASAAAFEIGLEREADGDNLKAFDAYQTFINNYKQSDLFGEAVKRQFEIAQHSMNAKSGSFLGMKVKTQNSRNIEMFQQVAANAPYSKFAPLSYFSIANLQLDAGDEAKAIGAFQLVIDEYGDTEYAAEARYAITQIRNEQVGQDLQGVVDSMLVGEDFVGNHPEHPKAAEVRAELGRLQDKEQEQNFNIGRFYEGKDNLRAAAIYYQKIEPDNLGPNGTYAAAKERLAVIKGVDPNLVIPATDVPRKVQAPVETTTNPNYLGPPLPKLTEAAKPVMRASDADVLPVPPPPSGE